MNLIKDINNRAQLSEQFDDPNFDDLSDLPDHIIQQLADDTRKLLARKLFDTPMEAATHAVIAADLAGLESDDDIEQAAVKVLQSLRM